MHEEYQIEYPEEGGYRRVLVSQEVVGNPPSDADMERLARFMTPPTIEQCEAWLAELSVLAPLRKEGEISGALKVQAYIKRLRNYPADIVHAVLLDETWEWFPKWSELEQYLEAEDTKRRKLLDLADQCTPGSRAKPLSASQQIERQKRGLQERVADFRDPAQPMGPKPYVPDPSPPAANVEDLKLELQLLKADEALFNSDHGKAYAHSLLQRIAVLESPKAANTNTTQEAV